MWYNPIMLAMLRSPLHGSISKQIMAITYTGRKSGRQYTTPVNYVRETAPGATLLWTLSDTERTWWRNLRGGASVMLLLQRQNLPATATVIEEPAAVAEALAHYLALAPVIARYIHVPLEQGIPDPAALAQAAQKQVVVRFALQGSEEQAAA